MPIPRFFKDKMNGHFYVIKQSFVKNIKAFVNNQKINVILFY